MEHPKSYGPGDGILSRVTAPPAEPLTFAEAKLHLRLDDDAEGSPAQHPETDLVEDAIVAAREEGETWTGRAWIEQTWDWFLPAFPGVGWEFAWRSRIGDVGAGFIVPKPPLLSVTHIKYIDTAGAEQTVAADQYSVIAPAGPYAGYGRIYPAYGVVWPIPREQRDAVRIRFVAGYAPTGSPPDYVGNLPKALKQGTKLLVADYFENREAQIVGVSVAENKTVMRLFAPFIVHAF